MVHCEYLVSKVKLNRNNKYLDEEKEKWGRTLEKREHIKKQ